MMDIWEEHQWVKDNSAEAHRLASELIKLLRTAPANKTVDPDAYSPDELVCVSLARMICQDILEEVKADGLSGCPLCSS